MSERDGWHLDDTAAERATLARTLLPPSTTRRPHWWAAKLTVPEVRDIRHRYTTGETTQSDMAREFGVSRTTIWHVVMGHRWKGVGNV